MATTIPSDDDVESRKSTTAPAATGVSGMLRGRRRGGRDGRGHYARQDGSGSGSEPCCSVGFCTSAALCAVLFTLAIGVLAWMAYTLAIKGSADDASAASAGAVDAPTPAWHAHAQMLRNYSDSTADPCVDFYRYSCGGWLDHTDIPTGAASLTAFDAIGASVTAQLEQIATDEWPIIGTWNAACMDTDARRSVGIAPLQSLLALIDSTDTLAALATTLAQLHRAGVGALFSLYVAPDQRNASATALYIDYAPTLLTRDVLLSANSTTALPEARAQYMALEQLVASLLQLSFDDMDIGTASALADQALAFERNVLAVLMPSVDVHAPLPTFGNAYELLVQQCAAGSGGVFWDNYWLATLHNEPSEVGVADMRYVCSALVAASGDTASVRAYLRYRVLVSYADAMPDAAALLEPLVAALTGVYEEPPLWAECLQSTSDTLGSLLSHYYVARYFPAASKDAALSIVHAVLEAFGARLDSNTWMDDATRQAALQKLRSIRALIAYPDSWSAEMPEFAILSDDYLGNVLRSRTASMADNWRMLGAPAPRYLWGMYAYEINAYYDPLDNDIAFPAGILQGAFFNAQAPLAANYGAFGAVAGHEITHAFDNEGRHFAADGSRRDWWTAQSSAAFDARAECVVQLYNSFEETLAASQRRRQQTLHVNGLLTLGENIADMGGLAAAHAAYVTARDALEPALRERYVRAVHHVYGMSDEQLLYRAWATSWCAKRRPQLAYERLLSDPHAPPDWRVRGPSMESAEFRAAFSCTPPSPSACQVW